MFLDILKISKIKTAQIEAEIPIKPTRLSPLNKLLKSSKEMLKTINAKANTINIVVKIFILNEFTDVKLKKINLYK